MLSIYRLSFGFDFLLKKKLYKEKENTEIKMVIALRVSNLTKEFGGKPILDNISFEVQKGEIFGVIGMSGSGKTTLLNHLIGFLEPDEGSVMYRPGYALDSEVEMKGLQKNLPEVKKLFGFAPQTPSFYPKLTVYENLIHFGGLYHLNPKTIGQNIANLLKMTQLEAHKNKISEHLSGGQQRRLSIICGAIHKPEVLILDEPTADLDPVLREETWKLIKDINRMGTTIVIASHFLEELEESCKRVLIVHDGRVAAYGDVAQIKKDYGKSTTDIHIETDPVNFDKVIAGISAQNVIGTVRGERRLTLHSNNPKETLYDVARVLRLSDISAQGISVRDPSLTDVFASIALGGHK